MKRRDFVGLMLGGVAGGTLLSYCANQKEAPPFFSEKKLFYKGYNGVDTYRIPSLLTTQQGTILAFSESRHDSRKDSGNIDVVARRSTDMGETWSEPLVVWDTGSNTCGNPCPVVDRDTGKIWLLLNWNLATDEGKELHLGGAEDTRRVYITSSEDDGQTWSDPIEITGMVKPDNWLWYATGPGVGIQLRTGAHKGRLVIPCDHSTTDHRFASHVIYSDDHGETWQVGGSVENGNECQVIERLTGELVLNMRMQSGVPRKKRWGYRGEAFSNDGGNTWENFTINESLIGPTCQASLIRYDWPDGANQGRLLFSNPASQDSRENMTVRLSRDDGKTYPEARRIHTGPSAYSCLTVLPDNSIGLLYEGGEQNKYESITFAKFNLEWLTASTENTK